MTQLIKKPDAEFGKAILQAAQEKTNAELQSAVIDEVRHLMQLAEKQESLAESLTKSAAAIRRRLEAVGEGKFAFDGKKIKYLDNEHDSILYRDTLEFITRNIGNWVPEKLL